MALFSSSQTVGELVTVEFVTIGDGLAALIAGDSLMVPHSASAPYSFSQCLSTLQLLAATQCLTAPYGCPLVVAPGDS